MANKLSRFFDVKAIPEEEQLWYYLIHSLGVDKEVQGYLSESELSSLTGVRTHLLRGRSSVF